MNLNVTTKETISTINGEKSPKQNVKTLCIDSQNVNFLPSGIEKLLPELEGIEIRNSSLKSISRSDVQVFPKLKVFHSPFNQLETLNGDLFANNQEILWIDFKNNKLEKIDENILKPLQKLKAANFEKNICIHKAAAFPSEMNELKVEIKQKC